MALWDHPRSTARTEVQSDQIRSILAAPSTLAEVQECVHAFDSAQGCESGKNYKVFAWQEITGTPRAHELRYYPGSPFDEDLYYHSVGVL